MFTSEKCKKRSVTLISFLLALALVISSFAVMSDTADAKSFTKSKPKITKKSAYLNNAVYLTWTKVKGAKKYQIQRAKVKQTKKEVKKVKYGKWKTWKTVKATSLKKKTSGDYMYRVRAVKGKKKSKWSKAKRAFGASGKITNKGYEPVFLYIYGDYMWLRVLVNNKTKSPMGFLANGKYTFYAINKKTGKVVKKCAAELDTTGIAKQVNPKKKQSLYFKVYGVGEDTYNAYENNKDIYYMISMTFYPNPTTEPMKNHMALACTTKWSESSIAAK